MLRGEVWFATTPGGDRPVLVLTRDPVADRKVTVLSALRMAQACRALLAAVGC